MDEEFERYNDKMRRYDRLLRQIRAYKTTEEQNTKFDQIKQETLFQIEVRFKRSNRPYYFPTTSASDEDFDDVEDNQLRSRQTIIWDLNTQRTVQNPMSPQRLSLDQPPSNSESPKDKISHTNYKSRFSRPQNIIQVLHEPRKRVILDKSQSQSPTTFINRSTSNGKSRFLKMPIVNPQRSSKLNPPNAAAPERQNQLTSTKSEKKSLYMKPALNVIGRIVAAQSVGNRNSHHTQSYQQSNQVNLNSLTRQNRLITEQGDVLASSRKKEPEGHSLYSTVASKKLQTEMMEYRNPRLQNCVDRHVAHDQKFTSSKTTNLRRKILVHNIPKQET